MAACKVAHDCKSQARGGITLVGSRDITQAGYRRTQAASAQCECGKRGGRRILAEAAATRMRAADRYDIGRETNVNFDKELDARNLSCPLPILKTKKALNELVSGQVLKVLATDPGSVKDMQAFATQTGNALLSQSEENKTYVFLMRKK